MKVHHDISYGLQEGVEGGLQGVGSLARYRDVRQRVLTHSDVLILQRKTQGEFICYRFTKKSTRDLVW